MSQPIGALIPIAWDHFGPVTYERLAPDREDHPVTDIVALKTENASRWKAATITPHLLPAIDAVVTRLTAPAALTRYKAVASVTHVPWYILAVIHEREASQSWRSQLAQGDPLDHVSRHVPAGRGPFQTWEAGAVDALAHCAPYAARWTDWTPGGGLTLLEEYNGLGYAHMGHPSPYVWASTDQYKSGKYVSDGHYDPDAVDHQIGCAALLKRMQGKFPEVLA